MKHSHNILDSALTAIGCCTFVAIIAALIYLATR